MPTVSDFSLLKNDRFLLLFISQCACACSAFIQVVAVARLLVDSTASGLTAGLGIVCAPLPGIVFSLFAGGLGDRFRTKRLLVAYDILRGLSVLLFPLCSSAPAIFCLMMTVSFFDVLYGPSKNKLLTALVEKDALIRANSVLNGGYGAVSLLVPMLTGLLIGASSIYFSFVIGGVCFLLSALLLAGIDTHDLKTDVRRHSGWEDVVRGIRYCLLAPALKRTILTLAVFDFGAVSVNIAFYALAFDKLHVSSGYWGLLLSVLYGMNLIAAALLLRNKKSFRKDTMLKANLLMIAVAAVWFFYSRASHLLVILAGIAAEGLCSALITTVLVARLLEEAHHDYTARVMGVRDLCSNVFKLVGIGATTMLLRRVEVGSVFMLVAAAVFIFTVLLALMPAGSFKTRFLRD
jgi:MFS family permease